MKELPFQKMTDNKNPKWLTKGYIEEVLRNNEKCPELSIDNIDIRDAVGKGTNYSSQLQRVGITYEKKDGGKIEKSTLIVKSLPDSPQQANFLITSGVFTRELHMYQVTLPLIQEIINNKFSSSQSTQVSPRFYSTSRPNTIIMADEREQGYKMADRKCGLDLPHAIAALKTLARFHAASYVLQSRDPKFMDNYHESFYIPENLALIQPFLEPTYLILPKSVETWPGFERFGEKLRKSLNTDRLFEVIKPKQNTTLVLNHGDFWLNNMLFLEANSTLPQVKMIDFQMIRYTSPAVDLQYFMHTSLSQVVREMFTDKLLEEYHTEFSGALQIFGCDPNVLTLEKLKDDMNEALYFGLFTACTVLPSMLVDEKDAVDMGKISEETANKTSSEEIAAIAGLANIYAGTKFKKVFQKMLVQFEKNGLFKEK